MDSSESPPTRPARPRASPPRVLVTAGPTHEPIDRVRYIGNRSSGRMGIALAEACLGRGWHVTLLLGPVSISTPHHSHLSLHRFQTTSDLQRLLAQHWPDHDLLLMAAAVADFQVATAGDNPAVELPTKIKRAGQGLTLELVPTPDLLAGLAPLTRADQTTIGFALEPPADLAREAARKLKAKNLDAIVANPLETMDAPTVSASLVLADGRTITAMPGMQKERFAEWLLDRIAEMGSFSRRG